jgi:DNA repair exonuclease SbcCD nuclease subunit
MARIPLLTLAAPLQFPVQLSNSLFPFDRMFQFIHAADLHLDSPMRGLPEQEGAPLGQLRGATRRACENLVNLAISEAVRFVVLAGDIYDGDWRDFSTGLFFRSQMARLNQKGIPVYLISGNHDADSVISRRLQLPENVRVFSTASVESQEVEGLPVVIHGMGFPRRAVTENLLPKYPNAHPGKFNIGLLHTSLAGSPDHDSYAPCSEQDLMAKGYDYWALGHIHQPEVLSRDPWIVFSGNTQGRHVRETGPRGCRLVSVDGSLRVTEAAFRHLDVVRWESIEVELSGATEDSSVLRRIRSALEQALTNAGDRLLALRLHLRGSTPLHGSLQKDWPQWRADIQGMVQDCGEDRLWIEQVKLKTTPVYDLRELASRDALTASVLESLTGDTINFNLEEIAEMLAVLPNELRAGVDLERDPENRPQLLGDVRTIVLEALKTSEASLS